MTTPLVPPAAPRGARTMNSLRWALFVVLLLVAGASLERFFTGGESGPPGQGVTSAAHAQHKLYRCPMHPNYTSDRPGQCPICGMTLELVSEHESHGTPAGGVAGLVEVAITPERVQRIGVRTALAERTAGARSATLVGFVAPDESRLSRVTLRVAGWVQSLAIDRTGQAVRQGEPLLTLYSPELFQSEQDFVIAMTGSAPRAGQNAMNHEAGAPAAGRERLRLLGVPEDEIARLERERTPATRLVLRAPASGTVLERNVLAGQAVDPTMPLYTIADLARVWVVADLYEQDAARVHTGQAATFVADGLNGRVFHGVIDFVSPTVTNETRTLKARIELGNADGALKPGMFGRVEVAARGTTEPVTVPSEAVVHTGEEDYVFLAHADGRFTPREVRIGADDGTRAEVLGGIAEGDTVVASSSFLIDSESRLEAAIAGLGARPHAGHAH